MTAFAMKAGRPSYTLVLQIVSSALLWVVITWASFYLCWPLIFLALAPFARLVIGPERPLARLVAVWVAGTVYFGVLEYWFAFYSLGALAILAALQGLSFLPIGVAIREGHRRRIPLCLTLPICWVAGEYLRSLGPFGFPVGALAPALFRQLWVIQIADLGGMFLVSFAIAMVSGALCDIWPAPFTDRPRWSRSLWTTVGGVMGVWLCIAGYGTYRLMESRMACKSGPVVAVAQPDVPWASDVGDGYDPAQLFDKLIEFSREAAHRDPAPELIVWPEASVVTPLNPEFCRADPAQIQRTVDFMVHQQPMADAARVRAWLEGKMRQGGDFAARIQALADETDASLIVGAPMRLPESNSGGGPWLNFNAAFFFRPHLPVVVQQKVHLFPAAERIPFVGTWAEAPFRWLAAITGAQPEFELQPGAKFLPLVFGNTNGSHAFTLPICGEIDLARTAGVFLPPDQTRLLVNISDDGMFQRSAMLQVRLSMLAYRAVESRSAIARSANTGVSCFVRSTGEIYGAVTNGQGESWTGRGFPERAVIVEVLRRKASPAGANAAEIAPLVAEIRKLRAEAGVEGYSVQRVDLDTRQTLYSEIGDAFAQWCSGLMLLGLLSRVGSGFKTPDGNRR